MSNKSNALPAELSQLHPAMIPKGTKLFGAGDKCQQFVYVVSGSVRVDLVSESGSNILLYRINSTDTCVLTTSCLMSGDHYSAEAIVEEDVKILTMPAEQFFNSIEKSATFRSFVFTSFSKRLSDLMVKVDEIAFRSIERRIASALLHHAKGGATVNVTHEQLATEVGTAREVISRKLSQWSVANIIEKKRGEIQLLAISKLESIASDR